MRIRVLFPFMQKYIPGNPAIVSEYMPGGGGRKAANYVYNTARPDGLTVGSPAPGVIFSAVVGETGVLYDIDKFIYLGTPLSVMHNVFFTRKEVGLNTLEKLRAATGVRIGVQQVGHPDWVIGRLFAWLLGLREPKFVAAYSATERDPALMRGETDAMTRGPDILRTRNREWVTKGLIDMHAILETPKGKKDPDFGYLPELESFTKSERERKVLALFRTTRLFGQPLVIRSGTPRERVEILQEAMRKTYRDPEFHEAWKKLTGGDPTPLMPEDLEKALRELPRDPQVVELFKKMVGLEPLPPR
ncbi:MAG: hypothetical protein HY695_23065 [Deltaproteobacteria bacterium]|nr:hypothetical protein [Deltaproteobacteria bacterium]